MTKETTAQLYEKAFRDLEMVAECDGSGCLKPYDLFAGLVAKIHKAAADIVVECPQSYDPSETITFLDGSRLYIANPRQAAYCIDIAAI